MVGLVGGKVERENQVVSEQKFGVGRFRTNQIENTRNTYIGNTVFHISGNLRICMKADIIKAMKYMLYRAQYLSCIVLIIYSIRYLY